MISHSGILRFATMLPLAVIAFAGAGQTQNAPSRSEGTAPLDGWYGEMEWSYHQKEDTSTPPDHSRSELKFDGKATIRVQDDGRGGLLGILEGSQKVDTHWFSYSLPEEYHFHQKCRGSAPPTPVRARVEGSPPSESTPLSLRLADVEAKISLAWSGGGPNAWCNAAIFPELPIDNGLTLSVLVGSLQPVGDGTYKAGFDAVHALMEAHFSLILRPSAIVPRG